MITYTEKQKSLIINNIVRACHDITKLNRTGYNFLYLASGFIAHYNLHGFIDYYQDQNLSSDILKNQRYNQWQNFNERDSDYDYYMGKKEIYNAICERLKK